MTVCIAALCNENTLIGASDRMLTAGDVQFEPQQSKIEAVTNSIFVMMAGDSAMQAEILHAVRAAVKAGIEATPGKWLVVRDVAEMYCTHCKHLRFKRAEAAILAPLGLDGDTFLRRQREMAPKLATRLATELMNFGGAPRVHAIIAGLDDTGGHIYTVADGILTCQDLVGFAAIGAGSWHADSQFMFGGHARSRPMPETLLLTYSAKKRAEVAPGVGTGTDMCMAGPALGSYFAIGEHVLSQLESIYQETQGKIREAGKDAEGRINEYVEELGRGSQAREQAAGASDGAPTPSADEDQNRTQSPEPAAGPPNATP